MSCEARRRGEPESIAIEATKRSHSEAYFGRL
jgi:hypothetical protein